MLWGKMVADVGSSRICPNLKAGIVSQIKPKTQNLEPPTSVEIALSLGTKIVFIDANIDSECAYNMLSCEDWK